MSSRRDFLRSRVIASAGAFVASKAGVSAETKKGEARASGSRPNIVLILANDMGFADLGCYGSEVETPNIYKLAADGLCFRQFYNSPRCRPSRTTLPSGLYAPQANIAWTKKKKPRRTAAYNGNPSSHCVTLAAALGAGGYSTAMVGKWHVTPSGEDNSNYPRQRGFDMFFGSIDGGGSDFTPRTLTRDNAPIKAPDGCMAMIATVARARNGDTMPKPPAAGCAPQFHHGLCRRDRQEGQCGQVGEEMNNLRNQPQHKTCKSR